MLRLVYFKAASAAVSSFFSATIFSRQTASRYFHCSRTAPAEFLIWFSICTFSVFSSSSLARDISLIAARAFALSGVTDADDGEAAWPFLVLPSPLTKATEVEIFSLVFASALDADFRLGSVAGLGSGFADGA